MPDTILIAEDEPRMRDVLRDYFIHNGAECDLARDGAEALDLLSDHDYDAILLDVMMPHLDGYAVCRAVRKHDKSVPILFLTALGGEDNTLYGYELGADDYITKPFSLRVVYAKTMALIRRSRGGGEEHTLSCGVISVNTATRAVKTFGKEAVLPPRAFDLLLCLMRNRGRVLGREELLDKVWGVDFEGDRRAVDVQIKNLRACLGAAGSQIRTVPKAGYQLTEEG